jgi:hypothetical protein
MFFDLPAIVATPEFIERTTVVQVMISQRYAGV